MECNTEKAMASSQDIDVLKNTWAKSVEPAAKAGYKDGAYQGQESTYQTSFDMGYNQGLSFGIYIGLRGAKKSVQLQHLITENEYSTTNCQICSKGYLSQEDNMVNLYNIQQEENDRILKDD